jgi:FixJ family two-component response regulator
VSSAFVAIVDDDEELRSSLVDLMRSAGHRAEPFASAETFLASSNLPRFDCVVADVAMLGMSGLDLVRRLREQGATIPAILMTALSDQHLHEEASSIGAQRLLRKPFEAVARCCHDNLALAKRKSAGSARVQAAVAARQFCNASPRRTRRVLRETRWR